MLFPMPGRTSWSSSDGRRSSSQDALPPVPAVQTDGFQGFPGGMFRRPDGVRAVVQLERVSTTYKKLKLVTSQHDWYDVLPTVTRRP